MLGNGQAQPLKDRIYDSINATKLQAMSNIIKHTLRTGLLRVPLAQEQSCMGQEQCSVGQEPCSVEQEQCNLGQNQCNLCQNQCNVGQNQCNVGQNQCNVGQHPCNVSQEQCSVWQKQCHKENLLSKNNHTNASASFKSRQKTHSDSTKRMHSDSNKRTSSDGSKQNKECVRHQRKPYTGTPQTQKDRSNAGTGYLLKTMDRLRLHINPHSSTLGHHQSVSCHHQNGKQDHLKSITEKSSSKEHVLTPSSKHSSGINKGQVLSYKGQVLSYKEQVLPYKDYRDTDRTSKKIGMLEYERNQLGCSLQRVDTQTKKMIVNSLKEPEKFQRILSDQILSVSYRVIRYRLIEIQIFLHEPVGELSVNLQKGNIESQGIAQNYKQIEAGSIITLFSAVRSLNYCCLVSFPKILLNIHPSNGHTSYHKSLTIPYTWLHFADRKNAGHITSLRTESPQRRSRIKTKTYIENMPLKRHTLKTFGILFGTDFCKGRKTKEGECEYRFVLQDQEYLTRLSTKDGKYTMELEGRGEDKMARMLAFMARLIA